VIYNYRFDREQASEILQRLQTEHSLSQGWGGGSEGNLEITGDDFVAKCKSRYELATTRVPTNLMRIRDLKGGDLLVVPHLPENGKVSVHVVAEDFPACYQYVQNDDSHQNHRIKIRRSYGLGGEISIRNLVLTSWYGKLQWLRLPLLPIPQFELDFRTIIDKLEQSPGSTFGVSGLAEYLEKLGREVKDLLNSELQKINPNNGDISFEKICKQLLVSSGYQVTGNQYDSAGGDFDLRCVRERSGASPFEAGETILLVQVKKYVGETGDEAVKQLLAMIAKEPAADGCVMSLGDSFTETAQKLADENGIVLMKGEAICQLLLSLLSKLTVEVAPRRDFALAHSA
jgi:hypothetical protein